LKLKPTDDAPESASCHLSKPGKIYFISVGYDLFFAVVRDTGAVLAETKSRPISDGRRAMKTKSTD